MTTRRQIFATAAGVAALAMGTSMASAAPMAPAAPAGGTAAPIEMQSEQTPRGRVLRSGSRGYYRRAWRERRARRRYWRRRAWRRGW